MAPVIVAGSSALLVGSAGAATSRTTSPRLEVCASTWGASFLVNGKKLALGNKSCGSVVAKVGSNKVTETSAPAAFRHVASISVSPTKVRVSTSVGKATAVVKLAAKAAATVKFVNSRVVTQAGSDGAIEVCKYATTDWGGSLVAGSFPFTITDGSMVITTSVAVGSCTLPISVPAGTVTVTEGSVAPYALAAVTSEPSLALGAVDLASGSAQLTVTSDQDTTANFINDTTVNGIKVCKILSNNEGSLAGSVFSFDIGWTFTPPTGASAISGEGIADVTAVASPGGACVVWTPPTELAGPYGIPVGSVVTVTENPFPYTAVTSVEIYPTAQNDGSTSSEAMFWVSDPTTGYTSAIFTNEPLGYVEVCKNFDPSSYNAENSAMFSVNGGPWFTVLGGACSAPIVVPAGTATVDEMIGSDFYLESVSTVSATDPFGTRLLTAATANPATVTVPYGGVGDETVVTFTNAVEPTQFKICTQETSADANLVGETVSFDAYVGESEPIPVSLVIVPVTATNPTGEVCSGLIDGPDVVNPDGSLTPITVTETGVSGADAVQVTNILYQGNGSVTSETPLPALPASITFDAGAGINVVTTTNGRTA
jgi:hypothetical protein